MRQAQVHRVDQVEPVADHLERVDLGQPRAVVAVVEVVQTRAEVRLLLGRIADAELLQPARQRVDALLRRVDEEAGEPRHVVVGETADLAEVDQPDRGAAVEHEDVRRMRVAVEEPVPEDHLHPRVGEQERKPTAHVERCVQRQVGELDAVEELERQHAFARVRPVDLRHAHAVVVAEVVAERLRIPPLARVVELLPDRVRELVDEAADVDEVEHAPARSVRPGRGARDPPRSGAAHPGAAPSPRRGRRSAARRGAPVRSTPPRSASPRTRGRAARPRARARPRSRRGPLRTRTDERRPGASAALRRRRAERRRGASTATART